MLVTGANHTLPYYHSTVRVCSLLTHGIHVPTTIVPKYGVADEARSVLPRGCTPRRSRAEQTHSTVCPSTLRSSSCQPHRFYRVTDSTDSDTSMLEESDGALSGSSVPQAADQQTQLSDAGVRSEQPAFNSEECQPSRFPIFRDHHVVARPAVTDKSAAELAMLTFSQWLDYYLGHPTFAAQRQYLFTDERYICLLHLYVSGMGVAEFVANRQLDSATASWLSHAASQETFKYLVMEYRGRSAGDIDRGPVLICFKEPPKARASASLVVRPNRSHH